jgi:hypothetical protein
MEVAGFIGRYWVLGPESSVTELSPAEREPKMRAMVATILKNVGLSIDLMERATYVEWQEADELHIICKLPVSKSEIEAAPWILTSTTATPMRPPAQEAAAA